jgi:hypothetical protein
MAAIQLKKQQSTKRWCQWWGEVRDETLLRRNLWGQRFNVVWGSKLDEKNEKNKIRCGLKWPTNDK